MASVNYAITSSSTVYIGTQFNKLVRASNGDLYASAEDQNNGPNYIILKKSTDGGATWSNVSTNVFGSAYMRSGFEMIIDANDVIHFAGGYVDTGSTKYIYYTKYTISTSQLASKTTLVSGNSSFQGIRIDSNGYLYCFYNDGNTLKCRKYTSSWADMTNLTVSGGESYQFCVDTNNNIYALFSYSSGIGYAMWNGSSWSVGVTQISSVGYFSSVSIDSSNNMYMMYRVNDGTYAYIYFRKWSGSSWGDAVEIIKTGQSYTETPSACSVITDRAGNVYVIYYYNYYSKPNNAYCCYKKSTNGGTSFGSETYIISPPQSSSQCPGKALNCGDSRYLPSVGFAFIYHWNSDYEAYIFLPDGIVWTTVAPTVTTQSADQLYVNSIRGNGNITNTGGANCSRRGFCYKVGTTGDPTTSDSTAYDDSSYGTGAYTKTITGLIPNTTYRVRAYAVNSAGTGYGTTVSAITDQSGRMLLMFQ